MIISKNTDKTSLKKKTYKERKIAFLKNPLVYIVQVWKHYLKWSSYSEI